MTDAQMMEKIKATMGKAIADAVAGTSIPPAFLAALAANESSGDPTVKRFESGVFVELAQVLAGRKANFGSLGPEDIQKNLSTAGILGNPFRVITGKLMDLATSWGPTQIMGYQVIDMALTVADLQNPTNHFHATVMLLKGFAQEWDLDLAMPLPEVVLSFFRCWNSGKPDGATADPLYVANGVRHMVLYAGLA